MHHHHSESGVTFKLAAIVNTWEKKIFTLHPTSLALSQDMTYFPVEPL